MRLDKSAAEFALPLAPALPMALPLKFSFPFPLAELA
jgi:hypothetical protein